MRILVVDDERSMLELMCGLFEFTLGHEVEVASTGEIGLQYFLEDRETNPFDLVVTDLEMPGMKMNGIELAEAVKAKSIVPVVLISGNLPAPENIPHFVDFALSKPFELAEIEQILEAVAAPVDKNAHLGTDQMLRLGFVTKDSADATFRFSPDGFRARRHLQSCRQCGEHQAVLGESVAFSA